MQWPDLWGKWWPPKDENPEEVPMVTTKTAAGHEREQLPLTNRQRQLTVYLISLAIIAAVLLQFTSKRGVAPILSDAVGPGQPDDVVTVAGAGSSLEEKFVRELEVALEKTLSQIEGVGAVEVMISVLVGSRLEVAKDVNGDKTTTVETDKEGGQRQVITERINEKVVIVREGQGSSDKPIVLAEHRPTIAGVLVVADGAKNPGIKLRITRAVTTAVDIPAHRVMVAARKK